LRRRVQAKRSQQWDSKSRDLRTECRDGLTDPKKTERSIDEKDRTFDDGGSDRFFEAFHFRMPHRTALLIDSILPINSIPKNITGIIVLTTTILLVAFCNSGTPVFYS
jgi:hypothetical protein